MIKIFRKIRQNLLSEGKTGKYLKYALGEIVLVVIGILIALSINNWNEDQKDRKIESVYLSGIKKELIADTASISQHILKPYEEKKNILKEAKAFYRGISEVNDTAVFVDKIGKFNGGWRFNWTLNTNVYKELESTGNLRKIRDSKFRQELSKYYSRLVMVQQISDNSESGFRQFLNENSFYDSKLKQIESELDYKELVNKLKEDEFYKVCNLELAQSQDMYYWALNMKERGRELLETIDTYRLK
ncbi:MAG: DUF6090 family protein [Cryomorphaceae bacterium]